MVELTKEQYHCVQHLLPLEEGYVEPKAVVYGNNPGWVFVDSPADPKAMIVWTQGNDGFYFIGMDMVKHAEDINRTVDLVIKPRLLSKGINYFEFSSVPPVTDDDLKTIFNSRSLEAWPQTTFTFKESPAGISTTPHEGQLWDARYLKEKHTTIDMAEAYTKIQKNWESLDMFFTKANGFFLIMDNVLVSFAITGWIAEKVHEISIETIKAYRRRGFAKTCAAALVNFYKQNGFIPYWECESDNTASAKTAQALGFTKLNEYICYAFKLS